MPINHKINPKQVALLHAKFGMVKIYDDVKKLEFVEFECGYNVTKFEDLYTWQLDQILRKLEKKLHYGL